MPDVPLPAFEAQPNLTPMQVYLGFVRSDVMTLGAIAATLQAGTVRKAAREEMRRQLAGVVAHCETLRLALK